MFCSPEQIEGTQIPEKTDIHGLAGVLVYLLCEYEENQNSGNNLLLSYINDDKKFEKMMKRIETDYEILKIIQSAFAYDYEKRPSIKKIRSAVEKWKQSGKGFIPADFVETPRSCEIDLDEDLDW